MTPGEPLGAARGVVQEGAAGIESFAHLLGSRRVGPRAVERTLPDVREGCAELGSAIERLAEALRAALGSDDEAVGATAAALAHAAAEIDLLGQGLSVRGAVDARRRLSLEASVRRAARELEASLSLVDLLRATLSPRPTPLRLLDVLRARSAAAAPGLPRVRVSAALPEGSADGLDMDARIVGGLVELVVGKVHAFGVDRPHVAAAPGSGGRATVRVAADSPRAPAQAVTLDLPLRDGGERAGAVARAAARRVGIALSFEDGGRAATLTI